MQTSCVFGKFNVYILHPESKAKALDACGGASNRMSASWVTRSSRKLCSTDTVLSHLLRWANCPILCSAVDLVGSADRGGKEDEVTEEVVTCGLVGCVPVGSAVDRPHTLSTCGEEQIHTQRDTPVRLLKQIPAWVEWQGNFCEMAPCTAETHINVYILFKWAGRFYWGMSSRHGPNFRWIKTCFIESKAAVNYRAFDDTKEGESALSSERSDEREWRDEWVSLPEGLDRKCKNAVLRCTQLAKMVSGTSSELLKAPLEKKGQQVRLIEGETY